MKKYLLPLIGMMICYQGIGFANTDVADRVSASSKLVLTIQQSIETLYAIQTEAFDIPLIFESDFDLLSDDSLDEPAGDGASSDKDQAEDEVTNNAADKPQSDKQKKSQPKKNNKKQTAKKPKKVSVSLCIKSSSKSGFKIKGEKNSAYSLNTKKQKATVKEKPKTLKEKVTAQCQKSGGAFFNIQLASRPEEKLAKNEAKPADVVVLYIDPN